jgi:hypothetical protein
MKDGVRVLKMGLRSVGDSVYQYGDRASGFMREKRTSCYEMNGSLAAHFF